MNGTFNWRERKQIEKALKLMANSPVPLITSVDMDSAMTVNGVQAKILEYQPDVVLIDGAYLMQSELPKADPGSAQALADIARGLKRLAQAQRIPLIVTTQASETRTKGGKLTASSAMYTQAWRQSADVMLGVERVDPEAPDTGEVMVRFKVLASRAGPRAETMLSWDWSEGRMEELDPAYFNRGATMALDLLSVLHDAGVQRLHEGTKEIAGACPQHEARTGHIDRHPSWSINKFSYLHFCQACQYGGTLTQLLTDLLGSAPEDLEFDLKQQSFLRSMSDVRAAPTQVLEPVENILTEYMLKYTLTDPPRRLLEFRQLRLEAIAMYQVRWNPDTKQWVMPLRTPGR